MKKHIFILWISILVMLISPYAHIRATTKSSFVVISKYEKSMNIGDEFTLWAVTSSGVFPTFKSGKSKIASVNTYGRITAKKAGTTKITVKIRGAEACCVIHVRPTTLSLNQSQISLERGQTFQIKTYHSTNHPISFRSSKSSIVSVNEVGVVLAEKPGKSRIIIQIDDTKKYCQVTVRKPVISFRETSIKMKVDEAKKIHVTTSSGFPVSFRSTKRSIFFVEEDGTILAIKEGTAYLEARLDGSTKRVKVTVKN